MFVPFAIRSPWENLRIFPLIHKRSICTISNYYPKEEQEKVRIIVNLEKMAIACFETLEKLIHNGPIKSQCRILSQKACFAIGKLKEIIHDLQNYGDQTDKEDKDYLQELSTLGVIDTALWNSYEKLSMYRKLKTLWKNQDEEAVEDVLEEGIKRAQQEIKFLKNEQNFQQKNSTEKIEVVFGQWLVELESN